MDIRFPGGMLAQQGAIAVPTTGAPVDLTPNGIPLINVTGVPSIVPTRIDLRVTPALSAFLPSTGYGTFGTMAALVVQVWTAAGGTGTRLDTGTNTMTNLSTATGVMTVALATLTTGLPTATKLYLRMTTAPANAGFVDFFCAGNDYSNY